MSQQPVHRRSAAGTAGIELADPVAAKAQLLLEQLLVLLGDGAVSATAGGRSAMNCGAIGNDSRQLASVAGPALQVPEPSRFVTQARPNQFTHEAIAGAVCQHRFEQLTAQREGNGRSGGFSGRQRPGVRQSDHHDHRSTFQLCPLQLSGRGSPRTLRCRVLQSPLAGVSDRIFRSLVRRWAPDALLFTEMVNATSLELGHGLIKVEELASEPGPIGVQLFDFRPAAMADAARRAEAAGAYLIDINMGCPVKKIAKKGGGSGLIRDPHLAAEIVAAVATAVRIPVTVKTRLGWCGTSLDPVGWCRELESAGAQLLTLHGRTREQGFKGPADWDAIAAVKQALTIPVIANGDVNSPADALACLAHTGADGVMVGRGTMGAPGWWDRSMPPSVAVRSPHPWPPRANPAGLRAAERAGGSPRRSRPADRAETHELDLHRLQRCTAITPRPDARPYPCCSPSVDGESLGPAR